MRLVTHPLTHENERYRGEQPLARVRFSIAISGGPVALTISLFSKQEALTGDIMTMFSKQRAAARENRSGHKLC
jgi:hypothetical protein